MFDWAEMKVSNFTAEFLIWNGPRKMKISREVNSFKLVACTV